MSFRPPNPTPPRDPSDLEPGASPCLMGRRLLASLLRILAASLMGLALLAGATYWGLRLYGHHRLEAAVARAEGTFGPLRVEGHAPLSVTDGDNAATWFLTGVGRLELDERELRLLSEGAARPVSHWRPELFPLIEELCERNVNAMAALSYAARLPGSSFGIEYARGDAATIPSSLKLATGVRFLTARARYELYLDDDESALASMRTLAALARALEGEVDLVLQFTGWTAESMFLALVAEQLERPHRSVIERHPELLELFPDFDINAAFERFLAWNLANLSPVTVGSDRGLVWKSWARPSGHTWRDRMEHRMIGELRAALELEHHLDHHTALGRDENRDPRTVDPVADHPTGTNLDRFERWKSAVLKSRQVVRLALAAREELWRDGLEADAVASSAWARVPEVGITAVAREGEPAGVSLEVLRRELLEEQLLPTRLNPPPPLTLVVPAPAHGVHR